MIRINRHRQMQSFRGHGTTVKSTLVGIINPTRGHDADFRKILPSQMDKLVAEGLFVRLPDDELGRPKYKITKLGLARLKTMEETK